MIDDDNENPLLDYLMMRQPVPGACVEPWLAYFLAMMSLFIAAMAMLTLDWRFNDTLRTNQILSYLARIGWPLFIAAPIPVVLVSAMLTAYALRSEVYELVRVTSLPDRAIVHALLESTVFWLRAWLTWAGGFTPLMVGGLIILNAELGIDGVPRYAVPLLIAMGFWGTLLLAIVLPVTLGARWRQWLPVAIIAGSIVMLINLSLLGVVLVPTTLVADELARRWLLLALTTAALPYLLSCVLWWLALRWIRHPSA